MLRPAGIIELERHACEHEQEKTGDDEEMKEALEWRKACEPFTPRLRANLRFAEFLRVMPVKVSGPEQPGDGVSAKEGEHADQQHGHEEKDPVQQRVVL